MREPSPDAPSVESTNLTGEDSGSTTIEKSSFSSSVSRPATKAAADFEGKRLGSYEIRQLLGKGGVGLVYLAWDQRLQRRVALKLLRTDDPEAAHRLLEEARSQARVEHENVCQVYEAGEIEGQTFIAMQYIEGQPLTQAFRDMSLEEKVRVIQRAAEGLEAAHAQNLIHRDVKPGNILVERTPRGDWKPYILDFGLAREQAAPGDTTTGEVKGTPSYMPPEQVTGQIHSLDARADVYSLGATFYEGLSGHQLFPDTSGGLAVMLKVLNEDPEPIRAFDPSIPVDVESIVMRCLEKDPERRYASARALAEDLQRLLDGEPIVARPISSLTRQWRRLKKRRVAALSVGLVATVLMSVAVLIASHLGNRARTRLMEDFRQDVLWVDQLIDHAYKQKIHDVTPTKAQVRTRLEEIRRQIESGGRRARGPGNYALGSGYLALGEYEKAYHHLMIAWQANTRDPEVGYALGRTLGALYEKELQIARRIGDDAQRDDRLREIEELYREPALDYLQRSSNVEVESGELVEALMALWEGHYEEALSKAQLARRRVPWLYEALAIQGDVHTALGLTRYNRGDYDEALKAFRLAMDRYEAAAAEGQSDARIYEGQCSLAYAMMTLELYSRRGSPEAPFQYGLEACSKARRVDPERPQSFELESMLYWRMGEYDNDHGIDPTDHLNRAVEAATRALEIAPDHVETYASLGWSQSLLARWQLEQGLDPRPAAGRALEAFRNCIERDPTLAQCFNGRGYTRTHLAEWRMANGEDADEHLIVALEALERSVVLEPESVYALDNLGHAYVTRATWELLTGEDPSSSVEEAVRVFSELKKLNPRYFWAHFGTGDAYSHLARHQLSRGEDPTRSILRARAAFESALEIDENEIWIPLELARLVTFEGRWEIGRGGDPEAIFRQARTMYEEGIERWPDESWGYHLLADQDLHWARWRRDRGRSAQSQIEHGLRMVSRAIEIDPGLAESWVLEGAFELLRAESAGDGERRRHLEAARAALATAFQTNSNLRFKYQSLLDRADELG